ncbi:hypothetical protein SD37_04885 [Amycolatopsis orientalis]|uniref:Uncharacterized protein n=1 Tax=Amycolatopsis orientalis TaxID=31958 RepID=A0A193BS76_AMYOR|nr:hypothetical protein SD37_04885 [Amycolatopsis orientalis]
MATIGVLVVAMSVLCRAEISQGWEVHSVVVDQLDTVRTVDKYVAVLKVAMGCACGAEPRGRYDQLFADPIEAVGFV